MRENILAAGAATQRFFAAVLTLACGVFACGLVDTRAAGVRSQQSATTQEQEPANPAAQTAANKRATKLVTDETGRRMAIPLNVQRVVSLAPNLTETIYALGSGREARGRHDVLRHSARGEGETARRCAAGSEPGSDRRAASRSGAGDHVHQSSRDSGRAAENRRAGVHQRPTHHHRNAGRDRHDGGFAGRERAGRSSLWLRCKSVWMRCTRRCKTGPWRTCCLWCGKIR